MLTEDYLMRMISQAVAALLQAIGLRKAGQYNQAHQTINQALEGLTGIREDLLVHLDDQAILERISQDDQIDLDRAQILADLFLEQGRLYEQQNQGLLARSSYQRALMLSLEIAWMEEIPNYEDLKSRIAELIHLLPGELPFDLNFTIFSFYENIGEYRLAEAVLQSLVKEHPYLGELEKEQQEFYRRLIEKSDQMLSEAGFSQAEIAQLRSRGVIF